MNPNERQMTGIDENRLTVLAAEIKVIRAQVRATVLSAACEIGKRLAEAKNAVPHGRFGKWLKENVDCSERQAQQLMALWEEYGKPNDRKALDTLSVSQAAALLAAPAEVRAELIESGAAGEMSVRALKEEVARQRDEIDRRQMRIGELEVQASKAQNELREARRGLSAVEQEAKKARTELDVLTRLNSGLKRELEEAQKVERVVEIEVMPSEERAELERLRELERRAPDANVLLAREKYRQGIEAFEAAMHHMREMDAGNREKYALAFAAALKKMAEKMETQGKVKE